MVEYVEGNTIHTIEGNRSDKVQRFTYDINSWQIYGYALPNYTSANIAPMQYPLIRKGSKGEYVRKAQQLLINKGYSCGRWGADAVFGNDTYKAAIAFQKSVFPNEPKEWDGIIGNKTWSKLMQ